MKLNQLDGRLHTKWDVVYYLWRIYETLAKSKRNLDEDGLGQSLHIALSKAVYGDQTKRLNTINSKSSP